MAIDSLNRQIGALEKEVSDLGKKISEQSTIESKEQSRISQIENSINKNTSLTTLKSKMREIERHKKNVLSAINKRAEFEKKRSAKNEQLAQLRKRLLAEESAQRKADQKSLHETKQKYEAMISNLQRRQTASEQAIFQQVSNVNLEPGDNIEYDVFISHASEDKDNCVRPLYAKCVEKGITAFYDEASIQWGEGLRSKIDKGLSKCKLAIVVVSKAFLAKKWTADELDALFAIETASNRIILPLWHDISKEEVASRSPLLAGRKALKTSDYTFDEIADMLKGMLGKEDDT